MAKRRSSRRITIACRRWASVKRGRLGEFFAARQREVRRRLFRSGRATKTDGDNRCRNDGGRWLILSRAGRSWTDSTSTRGDKLLSKPHMQMVFEKYPELGALEKAFRRGSRAGRRAKELSKTVRGGRPALDRW